MNKEIKKLKAKIKILREENDLLWDMCDELRKSDISNFPNMLQNMIMKTQEDAFYHAWIKKNVADNMGINNTNENH